MNSLSRHFLFLGLRLRPHWAVSRSALFFTATAQVLVAVYFNRAVRTTCCVIRAVQAESGCLSTVKSGCVAQDSQVVYAFLLFCPHRAVFHSTLLLGSSLSERKVLVVHSGWASLLSHQRSKIHTNLIFSSNIASHISIFFVSHIYFVCILCLVL